VAAARRLLAIRPGGVGDCILSFPAIESLDCEYLEVWVPSAVIPLIHFADRVRGIASTGLDLMGIPGVPVEERLIAALAQFDSIVSWYGGNRPEFREAMRGFPVEFHAALPQGSPQHACDFFCAQVGAKQGQLPRIPVQSAKRGFVAIHPFSGGAKKNWPLERFDEVARHFDTEWCATPEQDLGNRHPLLQVDDLGAVAQWLAEAQVYVGNDSGITHLAAAVGTPVVAIFQASDAKVWAPRGPKVTVLHSPSIEDVIAQLT
jgi:ADP-heptose:LPS heptosyltransferase